MADIVEAPQSYGQTRRRRLLVQALARHARAVEDKKMTLAAIDLVYDGEGRLVARPTPLGSGHWIVGGRTLDAEIEDLTVQLATPGEVQSIAGLIPSGFVGIILVLHARFRRESSENLLAGASDALVAALAMLNGEQEIAVYSLERQVTDFPEDDGLLPWEMDSLTQLLYTLSDLACDPHGGGDCGRVQAQPQPRAPRASRVALPPDAEAVRDAPARSWAVARECLPTSRHPR